MKTRLVVITLLLFALAGHVRAQETTVSYAWEAGDLALIAPSGWELPFATVVGENPTLYLAPFTAAIPPEARALSTPGITLSLIETESQPEDVAYDVLAAQLTPATSLPLAAPLANQTGVRVTGIRADGVLFGISRAAWLEDGRVLMITGRALVTAQASFLSLYEVIVSSLVVGASTSPNPVADTPLRFGAEMLIDGESVQGILDEANPEQRWTFEGNAGDTLTISATEVSRTGVLDVALRLVAPNGAEAAYNDDQRGADLYGALDAQIPDHRLPEDGTYTIVVERVAGDGLYSLGISRSRSFTLNAEQVTRLDGGLDDAHPRQHWRFEGQAGQVFTLTMRAENGSLDPLLQLYRPDGQLLAWNDDAADSAMGVTAQIVQVALPVGGTYTLDATRFEGAGDYSIVIVGTS